MYFPFFIARRYFSTRAQKNIVHRMRTIASVGIAISTMALLLVLSVCNGLEDFIRSLLHTLDPDIKIELKEGKTFAPTPELMEQIHTISGVEKVVEIIEDQVILAYHYRQWVVKMKGVSDNFLQHNPLADCITEGHFCLRQAHMPLAMVGIGIQDHLSINLADTFTHLQVYYPHSTPLLYPAYNQRSIKPGAVFAAEKRFDDNYAIFPIDFVTDLIGIDNQRTALEVQVEASCSIYSVQKALQKRLPTCFEIRNRTQQQAGLLRAMHIEHLFVSYIFGFILLVATLNIFFVLSMLVLEKRSDIAVLYTLGARSRDIQALLVIEGLLIGLSGALVGMGLAGVLSWLQETFGLISLDTQTSLIEKYPMRRQWSDFVYTPLGVGLATVLASYYPARLATKTSLRHVCAGR